MKKFFFIIVAAICMASCNNKADSALPRSSRNDIDVSRFDSLFIKIDARPTDELHSVLVVKDGSVIYEKYSIGHGPDELHICWSASKTFTAIGVGFAVQDGLMSVDDPVIKYFAEDELPAERCEYLEKMTVKDLLIMSSGFSTEILSGTNARYEKTPSKAQLAVPFTFEPGSRFNYNSMNTYLCSAIVSRVTGMKLVDYLKIKLFDPIGVDPSAYVWDESSEGYNFGGWGLHTTAETLAKAGLFMLQRGVWNGERLLQDSWFDEAMSAQIIPGGTPNPEDDWNCGYGYQMWACKKGGAFRFDGAWGQFCVVIPEKNAVVVMFSHAMNTSAIMNDMWNDIYSQL